MANRRQFLQSSGALVVCFGLPACARDTSVDANGHAMLDSRLKVQANGVVTLNMGKVELGQGIGTAIAQIAADELGVDMVRIQIIDVDTDFSPDESYTFSSISVQQSGAAVRRAASAGRNFLLRRAATTLNVDVSRLEVFDGKIQVDGEDAGLDYWQMLAGDELVIQPDAEQASLPASQFRYVGKSIPRVDIPGKVYGHEAFLQDLRLPGMVHARVVRPPGERAKLVSMDSAATETLPGVLKIVRDGNFVAVICEREQQARNAATTLRQSLEWDLPADLPESGRVYDWLKSAPSGLDRIEMRQDESPEKTATRELRAVYRRPFLAHASISPSAAVAILDDDQLTIWSHGQGMYPLRSAIAHVVGLHPDQVRCIHKEASGCYGQNGADDAACDAAALAMQYPGRPVRLQWERADEFAWEPYGSAMQVEIVAELDEENRIRSWNLDLWSCPHTGRPRTSEVAGSLIYAQHKLAPLENPAAQSIARPNGGADRNAVPIYNVPNMKVNKHLVTDMPLRVSALRGLGAYANVFAIESFMDELAAAAGEDPLAFRTRHLLDERALNVLRTLSAVSNWQSRPPPGSEEGWGLAFARYKNLASYMGIVFRLAVDNDSGRITLKHATAVVDAGLVVNPDGVRAQIEGGIIQSASWTLKEALRTSTERVESRDWSGYPILRFDEVPEVEVVLIENDDQPSLGVAETAQGPAAAAIANGVFHASGQRLRTLPLRPAV